MSTCAFFFLFDLWIYPLNLELLISPSSSPGAKKEKSSEKKEKRRPRRPRKATRLKSKIVGH